MLSKVIQLHRSTHSLQMSAITKFSSFAVGDINVGKTIRNKMGSISIPLTKMNNAKIYIQTPVMFSPFGISELSTESYTKYSLDLSFKNYEEKEDIATMHTLIESIDTFMVEIGVHNSVEWFGKAMSKEVIEELYRPLMRHAKDPSKYAPTFKMKFRNGYGKNASEIQAKAFDIDKNEMDVRDIQKGSSMKVIFEISPIWFVNKQFGISLNISQVMVTDLPASRSLAYNAFFEDSMDDNCE